MQSKLVLAMLIFSGFIFRATADTPNDLIRKGNSSYRDKKYDESEIFYRKSLEKDPKNLTAYFNLGNSLYKQNKFDESIQKYFQLSNSTDSKKLKEEAYYNIGNAYLKNKQYAESIDFYKKALRLDPKDYDAKYNLEYARRMMIMEQQQNKQQNQNQQNNQSQQNNQQQNRADNNPRDKNQQNRATQSQQPKMSQSQIENLLNALQSEEKKTQKEVKAKLIRPIEKQIEKNW
ncbi:MAG: tetratricopeptide repeat protein [Candidatus Kapaibacteriales bacterium]